MFTWKKDRANISDEEPTFHVRYLGCSETYVPVGPGCTSRHVQNLWDNAPSERNLKRVTIKLGLGGIWLKGVSIKNRSEKRAEKDEGILENETISHNEKRDKENNKEEEQKKRKENEQNVETSKKAKDKNDDSSVTHFKMEDVSYCAADKSANDRIFCWISRCNRETRDGDESCIGPLEVHAVLCSTVEKAQTMAAVMSRAFHLAYKEWRAGQQRESRKQQHKKLSDPGSDGKISDEKSSNADSDESSNVFGDERGNCTEGTAEDRGSSRSSATASERGNWTEGATEYRGSSRSRSSATASERDNWREGTAEDRGSSRSSATTSRQLSTSSSTSSLASDISNRSSASSKNRADLNKNSSCSGTEKRQETLTRQEISTG